MMSCVVSVVAALFQLSPCCFSCRRRIDTCHKLATGKSRKITGIRKDDVFFEHGSRHAKIADLPHLHNAGTATYLVRLPEGQHRATCLPVTRRNCQRRNVQCGMMCANAPRRVCLALRCLIAKAIRAGAALIPLRLLACRGQGVPGRQRPPVRLPPMPSTTATPLCSNRAFTVR